MVKKPDLLLSNYQESNITAVQKQKHNLVMHFVDALVELAERCGVGGMELWNLRIEAEEDPCFQRAVTKRRFRTGDPLDQLECCHAEFLELARNVYDEA